MSAGMYKSSFTGPLQQRLHKVRGRSKSVAARIPAAERTTTPSTAAARGASTSRAVAAASAAMPAAGGAAGASAAEFPPLDYKADVLSLCKEGLQKFIKFMPPLTGSRQAEWDLPVLLSRCDEVYDALDERLRLIPSHPQNLLQRKKTLACNIAFSVAPYVDVNAKKQRYEFNRLFGAKRDGPQRLTDQYVPDKVKQQVAKMAPKKTTNDVDMA